MQLNSSTWWGFQYLQNSSKDVAQNIMFKDFPGGPMVKNSPGNAGDMSPIPDRTTKIPHAVEQLAPRTAAVEPACLS